MKLVIDIPENVKERFTSGVTCVNDMQILAEALIDGKPIPTDAVDRVTIKEYLDSYNGVKTELSGDAVDRRAVYEIINDAYYLKLDDGAALQESVKQLPSITAQYCEDCVSRSDVLAIARDSCLDLDSYEDTREFCDEINDLPPVTPPHPKVGHWISLDTGKPSHLKDGMTTEGVKCSDCGEWLIASVEYACFGRYCPNCGSYNGGAG